MHHLLSLLFLAAHAAPFTDRDLAQTLRRDCAGARRCVIYTWSPHMPLSARGLETLRAYGQRHHVTIIPLLDPNANESFARDVQARRHLPAARALASTTLIRRGARVHYPSYNFAGGGRLRGPLVPGVRGPAALDRLVRKYL